MGLGICNNKIVPGKLLYTLFSKLCSRTNSVIMKRVRETERPYTNDNMVMYGTFRIRCILDDEETDEHMYCIQDLIRATVRSARNQDRALELAIDQGYAHSIGYYTEMYVYYSELVEVMSKFRGRNFFTEASLRRFEEWWGDNVPTPVVSEDEEDQEKRRADLEKWNNFVRQRKEKEEVEEFSDSDGEFQEMSESSEEEQEGEVEFPRPSLSSDELTLRCTVLRSLCECYNLIGPNEEELRRRLMVQIENLERVIEACTPLPPLFDSDDAPVRISALIKKLRPEVTDEERRRHRMTIGNLASDKHLQVFGIRPPRFLGWSNGEKRRINRYTEKTATICLVPIIENFDFTADE